MKKILQGGPQIILLILFLGASLLGMGQISQRGTATSATSANTTLTIAKPTGTAVGDVMIVNITKTGNTSTNASGSGWTLITGGQLGAGGTGVRRTTILYRVANGTEGSSFSFALGTGTTSSVGSIIAFSGVDGSVFDVSPGSLSVASGTSISAPGITTTTNNAAIIFLTGAGGTDGDIYSNWSGTTPALTEIMDFSNSSVTNSVGAAWGILSTAGNAGDRTVDVDGNYYNGGILLALKQAPISSPSAFTTPGIYSFTVTSGVSNLTIEAWGGGGGGYNGNNSGGGHGGGGGGYAKHIIATPAPGTYTVVVGAGGGEGSDGSASSFGANVVFADYGKGGLNQTTGGGAGGTANIGNTITSNGGNGGDGTGANNDDRGGGGGGAGGKDGSGGVGNDYAGAGGIGDNGLGGSGGTAGGGNGTDNVLGGGGGGGGNNSGTGGSGGYPGGGGGGGENGGGSGAGGEIIISWTNCATPTTFSVSGGGSLCSGGSGVSIILSGSESGVNYELYKDGFATGNALSGTGSALTFNNITTQGTYTIVGTRTSGGCITNMSGSATVTVYAAPSVPTVGTLTQPTCMVATGSVVLNGLPSSGMWTLTRVQDGSTITGTGTTTTLSGLNPGTYSYTVTQNQRGTGLTGEYFSNMTLTGPATLIRTDATVGFDWGNGGPDPSIAVDNFSVRWSGKVEALYSETYTFTTTSDDGVRLWVNGQKLVDNWTNHAATNNSGTINLIAGHTYDITLEFYENGGQAVAQLYWSSSSQTSQIIPQAQLYSSDICSSSASTPVTINVPPSNPAAPVIVTPVNPVSICEGSSIILNATAAGNTIDWYTSPTGGSSIGSSVSGANFQVTPTVNATYYAEARSASGCVSLTRTAAALITINALPTATISGSTAICSGDNAVLSIDVTGTGPWSGTLSNGQSFSGSNSPISITVSPSSSTTYTIASLNDAYCTSPATNLSGAALVTVLPQPIIALQPTSLEICDGGSGNLTVSSPSSFPIYQWQYSANAGGPWSYVSSVFNSTPVFFETDFSALPANTNVYGNASLTGGVLQLTPASGSQLAGFVIQRTPGMNLTAFNANFDYRIYDGSGADGISLSFGPDILNDAGSGETGQGSGIIVMLDTYDNAGASTNSQIRISYGGINVWSNSLGAFNLRNTNYRNVNLYVDHNGGLSLTIDGTVIVNGLTLTGYANADKTNWKFKFSGRTGGLNDRQTIDNLKIKFGDSPSLSVSPIANTYYRCVVSSLPLTCSTISNSVLASINPAPQGSLTGGSICSGDAGQLIFNSTSGTGPFTLVINGQTYSGIASGTPFNVNPNPESTTSYTLTSITDINTCQRISGFTGGSATINVISLPTVSAGNSGPFCAGSTLNLTASNIAGATYSWTGPNGFTSSQQNPSVLNATLASNGTYSVTATVNGCTSPAGTTDVVVQANSVGGSLSGGISPICQGSSMGTLTLTGYNGTIVRWERQVNSGGWSSVGNGGNASYSEVPYSAGTWEYRAIIQNGSCSEVASGTISIDVDATTVGGGIYTGNTPICTGASTGTMTLTGYTGSVVRWEKRVDGGPWSNISNTIDSYSEIPSTSGTWQYRALVQSGACISVYSSAFTVVVNPTLTISLGNNPVVCQQQTSTTLSYSETTGNPAGWILNFDDASNPGHIDDQNGSLAAAPNTIPINVPYSAVAGIYHAVLTVITYYPACTSADYPVTLTVRALPIASISGNNGPVCSGSNASFSLSGTSNATVTYNINGGTNTTVVLAGGTASVTISGATTSQTLNLVSVDNGSCSRNLSGSSIVSINSLPSPTINGSSVVCAGEASSAYYVTNVSGHTYSWFVSGGTITTGTGTSSITVNWGSTGSGTVDVTETITATTCSASAQQKAVTINSLPTPSFIVSSGASECQNDDVVYTTQPGQSNYVWTISGVLGTDYSITSGGTGISSSTVTIRWLTTGVKSVTVNYKNSTNCFGGSPATSSVTVDPVPNPGTIIPD